MQRNCGRIAGVLIAQPLRGGRAEQLAALPYLMQSCDVAAAPYEGIPHATAVCGRRLPARLKRVVKL